MNYPNLNRLIDVKRASIIDAIILNKSMLDPVGNNKDGNWGHYEQRIYQKRRRKKQYANDNDGNYFLSFCHYCHGSGIIVRMRRLFFRTAFVNCRTGFVFQYRTAICAKGTTFLILMPTNFAFHKKLLCSSIKERLSHLRDKEGKIDSE